MKNLRTLILHSLFVALLVVVTLTLAIPFVGVGGYFNLSDAIIMLAVVLDMPLSFCFGAGLGPALADLASGYGVYVPFTFVIKATVYLLVYFLYHSGKGTLFKKVLPFVAGGLWMAIGYGLADAFITSNPATFLTSFLSNIMQGASSAILIIILMPLLDHLRAHLKKFER